jgi:hypothetical protein
VAEQLHQPIVSDLAILQLSLEQFVSMTSSARWRCRAVRLEPITNRPTIFSSSNEKPRSFRTSAPSM